MKVVEGSRFASVAFAAALASCATAEAPGPMLEGSRWQVIAIDGQVTPRTDLYQLEFKDGRASPPASDLAPLQWRSSRALRQTQQRRA